MIERLLFVLWFFLPSGVANVAAFFSGQVSFLKRYNAPVDFGLKFRGKRILGSNKTIRGFVVGIISAIVIVYFQIFLYSQFEFIRGFAYIDYSLINPLLFGFLSGFGALAGDSIKSFFKRQNKIAPGVSWFPFDQIDFIIGGIIFTSFYIRLSFWDYFWVLALWFLIHPFTTFLGFLLKLKKEPL